MKSNCYDTSQELFVYPYKEGIKLVKPDYLSVEDVGLSMPSVAMLRALPINIYFLTQQSQMKNINEICAETMGFASINDSFEKTMFDISPKDNAEKVIRTDKEVIRTQRRKIVEDNVVHFDGSDEQHFLTVKMPWYNDKNEMIGLFGCSILFGRQPFAEALSQISQYGFLNSKNPTHFLSGSFHNNTYLTKREKECIYYLIRGKTAREISQYLKLSPRTVESHIQNLKHKLNVSTKSELIDKIIYDYL